jgi:hypothetical protein
VFKSTPGILNHPNPQKQLKNIPDSLKPFQTNLKTSQKHQTFSKPLKNPQKPSKKANFSQI